jgi:hypothetical protein
MFRLFYGGRKDATCKHAPGSKREQFSAFSLKTLGTGDILCKKNALC